MSLEISKATFYRGIQKASELEGHILFNSPQPMMAFVGRSNVGKSSLINALAPKNTARTSKTPGRTQQINIFLLETNQGPAYLCDLPGYGHAKVSKKMRAEWDQLMGEFFYQYSLAPKGPILCLQDAKVPLQKADFAFIEVLRNYKNIDCWAIFNKFDKCKQKDRAALKKVILEHSKDLAVFKQIHRVSATDGKGLTELRNALASTLSSFKDLD